MTSDEPILLLRIRPADCPADISDIVDHKQLRILERHADVELGRHPLRSLRRWRHLVKRRAVRSFDLWVSQHDNTPFWYTFAYTSYAAYTPVPHNTDTVLIGIPRTCRHHDVLALPVVIFYGAREKGGYPPVPEAQPPAEPPPQNTT